MLPTAKKFTVVGCGSIGSRHIRNLIALGVPAENIAGVDGRVEALDALPAGVRRARVQHLDEMTKAMDADALLICTPASHHAAAIDIAIHHGIPFFVEKPATLSAHAEIDWGTSVPHLVACNMRFRQEAADLLVHNKDFTSGEFTCLQDMTRWPGRGYAHPIFEFCHEIDLALWLFGPAASVKATAYDAGLVKNGRIRITLGHEHHESHLHLGQYFESIRIWRLADKPSGRSIVRSVSDPLVDVNEMYLAEMRHFLMMLNGHEPSFNTLAQAREVIRICEQATAMAAA